MNDEILKKLEARLDRRSFLRGSSVGVAALLGVAAASPLVVFAQAPQDKSAHDQKKSDDKKTRTRTSRRPTTRPTAEGVSRGRRRRQVLRSRRRRGPRVPRVRAQHVSAGPHLDLRELRLQLHRVASAAASISALARTRIARRRPCSCRGCRASARRSTIACAIARGSSSSSIICSIRRLVEHAVNAVGRQQQQFAAGQRLLDDVNLGPRPARRRRW